MRVWLGVEMELAMNYPTLFIETSTLTMLQIKKILELSKNTGISRLYFGAGKIEFTDFERLKLFSQQNFYKHNYIIIVETTSPEKVPKEYQIVYRIEPKLQEDLNPNTIIKIETLNNIATSPLKDMFNITLETLNKNKRMYLGDKLLWSDEE